MNIKNLQFTKEQFNNCRYRLTNKIRLKDDDLLILLEIIIKIITKREDIFIIDPLVSEQILNYKSNEKTIKLFLNYFKNNNIALIIIPLFNNNHWSLSLYNRMTKRLLHMDSIINYHHLFFNNLYDYLIKNNIKISEPLKYDSINQKEDWECGYFVILFFYIYLKNYINKDFNELYQPLLNYQNINIEYFINYLTMIFYADLEYLDKIFS